MSHHLLLCLRSVPESEYSSETLATLIPQNRFQTFMNCSLKVIQGVWGDGSVAERVHRPVRGAKSGFQHPCWVHRTTCNSSSKVSIISGLTGTCACMHICTQKYM